MADELKLSCSQCGKRIGKTAAFCPHCGAPGPAATDQQRTHYWKIHSPDEEEMSPSDVIPSAPTLAAPSQESYPPHRAAGQIVGMFSAVGAGLGIAALLFLWATDFFEPTSDLEDLGRSIGGAISLSAVFIFAILIGVVLAAFGGLIAARAAASRAQTVAAATIGALLGHLGLVIVLGLILLLGIEVLSEEEPTQGEPTSAETRSPEEIAECREIFGEDAEICQPPQLEIQPESSEDPITLETMARLLVGLVPAGLVGAISGAALFRKP